MYGLHWLPCQGALPRVFPVPEGEQRLSEEAVQGEDEVLQRAAEAEEGTGQEATGGNGVWQLSR